jgi:hypothetical protein
MAYYRFSFLERLLWFNFAYFFMLVYSPVST